MCRPRKPGAPHKGWKASVRKTLNKHPHSRAERMKLQRKYSLKHSPEESTEYDPRGIPNKKTKEESDNREA